MALDPSIILGVKAPQFTTPQELYAQKAQFDQNELANRLGQAKMQEFEQGQRDNALMRDTYKTFGTDTAANVNSLYRAGLGKQAQDYSKAQGDLAKDRATTSKTSIEAVQKVNGILGSAAYSLAQNPNVSLQDVQATLAQIKQQIPQEFHAGLDAAQLPNDPAQLRQALLGMYTKSIETEKLLADKTSRDNNAANNKTSRDNNAATVGATIRGQDKVDARAREGQAMALSKPFEITGEDGKPVLVQQDKQGGIRPVQGYQPKQGASKPLNEGQSKALLFGSRMQEANSIFDNLAAQGTTKSVPGSSAPVIGGLVTALGGEKNQKLEQAKRDFINATLRRESGAAIAASEFDNAEKQYFPQVGDSKAVIEQKKRNREVATRGVLAEVPDSDNRVSKVRGAAPAAAAPNIDALLDKYK